MVEKIHKDEKSDIDSDTLRQLMTSMVMILTASRADTAKLFAQDKIYRAQGGTCPSFETLSPDGKLRWAAALTTENDEIIRPFDSYDSRESFLT